MRCWPRGQECIAAALLISTLLSESTFCACEGPAGASGLVLWRPVVLSLLSTVDACQDVRMANSSESLVMLKHKKACPMPSEKLCYIAGAPGNQPKPHIRNAFRGASLNDEQ